MRRKITKSPFGLTNGEKRILKNCFLTNEEYAKKFSVTVAGVKSLKHSMHIKMGFKGANATVKSLIRALKSGVITVNELNTE